MKLQVKPATAQECTFSTCTGAPVGELRALLLGRGPWPMCDTHIKPGWHPPDLRDQLVRWPAAGDGA